MIDPAEETGERFLPSVDRLEAAMRAGMRALVADEAQEALRHFHIALKLKPEYDAAWLARGHALRRINDLEGALQSFTRALQFNRDSEAAWMGLASALHALGRPREEVEAYDEFLRMRPRSVEAWLNRGAALHGMRDYRGAIASYEEVIALRPELAAAWNNKGAALLRLGKEEAAERCFSEALHFDPDFYDAMLNRIFLLQRRGLHGETVIWVDRALRIHEAGWLWYLKGLAHLGLLESGLAIRSFERALAMDKDLKEARTALRRAKRLGQKVDLNRGVFECFGTHAEADLGCAECEIAARCREVTP